MARRRRSATLPLCSRGFSVFVWQEDSGHFSQFVLHAALDMAEEARWATPSTCVRRHFSRHCGANATKVDR